jgi:hypothetical protein
MISSRTLLNALQKAQVDTIELLTVEMAHHALCWRSINTIPHYSELLVSTLKPIAAEMDQAAKGRLAEGLQWVEINLQSATQEINADYKSVTRRTVIVLADIIENLIESTIGICLLHLDPVQTSIREVTTFKTQARTERLLRQAVRVWESRLFADMPARTLRIEHMIIAFFPAFEQPRDFEVLDQLFVARNQFTHELIRLSEDQSENALEIWSLAKVDQAFKVASDLLIALMTAIPGELQAPINVGNLGN